jgi:hypothetical protein
MKINGIESRPANDEMVQGYLDGFDLNNPEPSENRSHSYRHGFANARDDRAGMPRASAQTLREMADRAMDLDDRSKLQ